MTDARITTLWIVGLLLAGIAINVATITRARAEPGVRASVIGGRASGCPRRFCGCALSIKLFGRQVSGLNIAWEWARRFPRTSPSAGAVAVRRGHVFQLVQHVGGNKWLTWDANSGGGKIRIHVRSIAGHVIVSPTRGG